MSDLSAKARDLLWSLFNEQSAAQMSVGVADQVVEIRAWLKAQGADKPQLFPKKPKVKL